MLTNTVSHIEFKNLTILESRKKTDKMNIITYFTYCITKPVYQPGEFCSQGILSSM
jgi:hypothetical protein